MPIQGKCEVCMCKLFAQQSCREVFNETCASQFVNTLVMDGTEKPGVKC